MPVNGFGLDEAGLLDPRWCSTPFKTASDLNRLLEGYSAQLSPGWVGTMDRDAGFLMIARVLKLLVELELKRLQ